MEIIRDSNPVPAFFYYVIGKEKGHFMIHPAIVINSKGLYFKDFIYDHTVLDKSLHVPFYESSCRLTFSNP